ncbi:MAG: formylglycine-generating enzyme family protein [Candidatus Electrothrix scaldis]|nr:MAG: formylglycine-generating enzyme family protein [Candidatus Electrothrix sp. GW3-3]
MRKLKTQVSRADILRFLAVTRRVPWNAAAKLTGYSLQLEQHKPKKKQQTNRSRRAQQIQAHLAAETPVLDKIAEAKEITFTVPLEAFWYLAEKRSLKKTIHRLTEQSEFLPPKEKRSALPGVLLQVKPLSPEEISVPEFKVKKRVRRSPTASLSNSPLFSTSSEIKQKKNAEILSLRADMESLVVSYATFTTFRAKAERKKQQSALKKRVEEKAAHRFHLRLHRLLGLISVAEYVDPALLQEIICLLPSSTPDIRTEAALQSHPDVERADTSFLRIKPEKKKIYQATFSQEGSSLQADLLGLLRQRDATQAPFLFSLELLVALPLLHSDSMQKQIIIWLEACMLRFVRTWFDMQEDSELTRPAAQFLGLIDLLPKELRKRFTTRSFLYGIVHRDSLRQGALIPAEYETERVLQTVQNVVPVQYYQVLQQGELLRLYPSHEAGLPSFPGSPLVELELSRDILLLHRAGYISTLPVRPGEVVHDCTGSEETFILQSTSEQFFFGICFRPSWAESIGRNKQGLFVDARWLHKTYRLHWTNSTKDGAGNWQGEKELQTDQYGLFVDLSIADQVVQRFRRILPGEFMMGSPKDEPERQSWGKEALHKVILSTSFWIADTVVTQRFWQEIVKTNSSRFRGAERPVEKVSYHDAMLFLQQLNERMPGIKARLLTEAEWEYCCRAGSNTPFAFGHRITPDLVNYNGQYPYHTGTPGKNRKQTVPVKSLPCNAWGLYEMHGNVWEWCQDYWQENLSAEEPQRDPQGPATGEFRVVRGGSWSLAGRGVRSAVRGKFSPHFRNSCIGLRIALSPDEEPAV